MKLFEIFFQPSKITREKSSSPLRKDSASEKSWSAKNGENSKEVIVVSNVKTDFVERDSDLYLCAFLYIKNVRKENLQIIFEENSLTVRFSTW